MEVLEQHGLPLLRLRAGPHSVDLFKHGAHVVSWKVDGEEQLFVSGSALFAPPKPIRGGVPVCWPQFNDMGPLSQQHGFARNLEWSLVDEADASPSEAGGAAVELELCNSEATFAAGWPYAFCLRLRVALSAGGELAMRLRATNRGASPFTFTTALHTLP